MTGPGVYILKCCNGRYYVGSTDDIERRYAEHCRGIVKATKNILPVELTFFQNSASLPDARRVEYRLKQMKSKVVIEKILADGYIRAASSVG